MGHCLIMGRRTVESLHGRSLPGRRLILISHQPRPEVATSGTQVARSLDAAFDIARNRWDEKEAFIAGGGEIFAEALGRDMVDRMYLTWVHGETQADTFFPDFPTQAWVEAEHTDLPADADNPHALSFVTLNRRHPRTD